MNSFLLCSRKLLRPPNFKLLSLTFVPVPPVAFAESRFLLRIPGVLQPSRSLILLLRLSFAFEEDPLRLWKKSKSFLLIASFDSFFSLKSSLYGMVSMSLVAILCYTVM